MWTRRWKISEQRVLLPISRLFTSATATVRGLRAGRGGGSIEITSLPSSASPLSSLSSSPTTRVPRRSFSEHFPPYGEDSKHKCPTKDIFELIKHGSVDDLREWIEIGGIDVNCRDEVSGVLCLLPC